MTGYMAIAPELFQHGDRLSREEFLERWYRMPLLKNAELIDGVVYVPGPVSIGHSGYLQFRRSRAQSLFG